MSGTTVYRTKSVISKHFPAARAKTSSTGTVEGVLHKIHVPLGPTLLVDGTTYKGTLFVCPVDGGYIRQFWIACAVAIASGTTTLAVENYDKSATTGLNPLSTSTVDATATAVTAKQGLQLTNSTTETSLYMDQGDVLNYTLTVGTQGTAGQGYGLTVLVVVPEP